MPIFYSASAGGFLDDTIHDDIPADARPLTAEAHKSLIDAACSGAAIVADEAGNPVAIPLPPPGEAELLRQLRTTRDKLLGATDYTQMPDSPLTPERREEWRLYRQALRDLTETTIDFATVEWPTPPSVRLEFS